ncbi:MAG TPA: 23S rRNA (guanosine(2251)-2'-O)-methyltransferase RlmB [Bacillota bacterium]|jgi:23S rRNA (guanosine2251-2'-O)-methyltransferase|nr:23S rRNA (guanosine(2251)-2'-O)-methyltransferase RlmB [Bacillota bacterium]HPU61525.1 23S rRNA (guanosine(2251)-2'-O)-methyltransferase RlmB [Bacillota bacterium]
MDNETTIEGRNAVMEALRAGRPLAKIMLAKGIEPAFSAAVKRHARSRGIPVVEVGRSKLDAMSAVGNHQGVIALGAEVHCYSGAGEILDKMQGQKDPPLFVILDGIKDPHNLGAIIRTCDAVGATGVVIPKRRACGLTSAVAKASAGAVEYVPCARVSNLAQEVDRLKKEGFWIVGTSAEAEKTMYEIDLTGPLGIVIGSEGEGISNLLMKKCDFLVRIPSKGRVSSLNASVAAAVILYEVFRQRQHACRFP